MKVGPWSQTMEKGHLPWSDFMSVALISRSLLLLLLPFVFFSFLRHEDQVLYVSHLWIHFYTAWSPGWNSVHAAPWVHVQYNTIRAIYMYIYKRTIFRYIWSCHEKQGALNTRRISGFHGFTRTIAWPRFCILIWVMEYLKLIAIQLERDYYCFKSHHV